MLDVNIKVVLLGSAQIGKTCLVCRYIENKFLNKTYSSTIGAAYVSKEVFASGRKIVLGIWDTAGEEKFEAISRAFYRNAKAAIVCYNVTFARSWERAKIWISELRQFEEDCKIYLCATQMDLIDELNYKRAVPEDIVLFYVNDLNIKYFETSSKTGKNVDILFNTVANDYAEENQTIADEYSFNILEATETQRKLCCYN